MPQADGMLGEAIIIRLARSPCQLEGPGCGADVPWRWCIWSSVGRVCGSHLSSAPLLVSSALSPKASCLRPGSCANPPVTGTEACPKEKTAQELCPHDTARLCSQALVYKMVSTLPFSTARVWGHPFRGFLYGSATRGKSSSCLYNQPTDPVSAGSHRWPTARSIGLRCCHMRETPSLSVASW